LDYGTDIKAVRGLAWGVVRFSPKSQDRCKIKLTVRVDAGGNVPVRVGNSKIPVALADARIMHDIFARDDEVDAADGDELARVIDHEPQVYDADEEQLIGGVHDKLGGLKEEEFRVLDSPDHLVHMSVAFKEESNSGILRASTVRPPPHPPPTPPHV
jgi:hypothetical protein